MPALLTRTSIGSELALDALDGLTNAGRVADIEGHPKCARAGLFAQAGGHRLGAGLVEVSDGDGITVGGQRRADGLADASRSTRDERNAVGRLDHGGLLSGVGDWNVKSSYG